MADYPKMIYKDFAANPGEYLIVQNASEETRARKKGWRDWDEGAVVVAPTPSPDPVAEVSFTPADPAAPEPAAEPPVGA